MTWMHHNRAADLDSRSFQKTATEPFFLGGWSSKEHFHGSLFICLFVVHVAIGTSLHKKYKRPVPRIFVVLIIVVRSTHYVVSLTRT